MTTAGASTPQQFVSLCLCIVCFIENTTTDRQTYAENCASLLTILDDHVESN